MMKKSILRTSLFNFMITLKIDKTKFNKQEMIDYLEEVKQKIKLGSWKGSDWDLEGREELTPNEN